jgi:hypothetical protein
MDDDARAFRDGVAGEIPRGERGRTLRIITLGADVAVRDADSISNGAGAAAPIPPNQRPADPRRSSTPKCSRAAVSTYTTSPALITT